MIRWEMYMKFFIWSIFIVILLEYFFRTFVLFIIISKLLIIACFRTLFDTKVWIYYLEGTWMCETPSLVFPATWTNQNSVLFSTSLIRNGTENLLILSDVWWYRDNVKSSGMTRFVTKKWFIDGRFSQPMGIWRSVNADAQRIMRFASRFRPS